jgi:hypothetical protein
LSEEGRTIVAKTSIVGDVINFRGFVYGPVNEMGVVGLFVKISEDLGFIIEEIRAAYPDCIARRKVDRGWERVSIEFEFKSSNFKVHGHDPAGCDLIVCWENDWVTCPVSVLSLKQYLEDSQAQLTSPLKRVRIADPARIRQSTLTAGGIKNGYINIKPLDDFWPEECIGGNTEPAPKHFIVEFDGVGRVATDISGRHKTFRTTHGAFKQFVEKHGLRAGDALEIIRLAPYEFLVRPAIKTKKSPKKD